MNWARILAFVTGMMDKELLTRSEYLVAENRIPKAQLKGRLKLSDAERSTLGEIGLSTGRSNRDSALKIAIHAGPTGTFQISSAYSRTARSEQNHPTRAVFRMLACHHAARSCHSLPTSRCLA